MYMKDGIQDISKSPSPHILSVVGKELPTLM